MVTRLNDCLLWAVFPQLQMLPTYLGRSLPWWPDWTIVYFGSFSTITNAAHIFGLLFPQLGLCINCGKNVSWAIFLQTHLFTLFPTSSYDIVWLKTDYTLLVYTQGDQIGRIFAQWIIVYFGHWFETSRRSAHFWATFLRRNLRWNSSCATFSQPHLGPMLWFFKYFRRKFLQTKLSFLTQNKAKFWEKLIITLVFKKNAIFFAENCQK
jgi:hypothetical protein